MKNYFFRLKEVNNNELNSFIKKTQRELSDFFGIQVFFPNIFFIQSRKQFDDIWKMKSKKWMSGGADGRNIFILDPSIYTKESDHKNLEHFWKTLKHEYCHLYYRKITGTGFPKWLNEGLANYLANQIKKEPTKEKALEVFDYYNKSDWQIYDIGYFWVKLLIEKFGKKKLLTLVKSINSQTIEKEFAESFYQIYKFRYSRTDFEKLLK